MMLHLQPKRLALLSYLALCAAGTCRRDSILTLFWPEVDEHRARNALNQSLHGLREILGTDVVLSLGRDELTVSRHGLWCDARAFLATRRSGDHRAALELYTGNLLHGLNVDDAPEFDYWLDEERDRFRGLASASARLLADQDEARGDLNGALRWLQRMLEIDPDDECALRALLRVLESTGDRAGALRLFERAKLRLKLDLDLDPAPETIDLVDHIRGLNTG